MVQKEVEGAILDVVSQLEEKIQQAFTSEANTAALAAQIAKLGDFQAIFETQGIVKDLCEGLSNTTKSLEARVAAYESSRNTQDKQVCNSEVERRLIATEARVTELCGDDSLQSLAKRAIELATETSSACNIVEAQLHKELADFRQTITEAAEQSESEYNKTLKLARHAVDLATEAKATCSNVRAQLQDGHADLREALTSQQANLEATLEMARQGFALGDQRHELLAERVHNSFEGIHGKLDNTYIYDTAAESILKNWEAAKFKMQHACFHDDRPQTARAGTVNAYEVPPVLSVELPVGRRTTIPKLSVPGPTIFAAPKSMSARQRTPSPQVELRGQSPFRPGSHSHSVRRASEPQSGRRQHGNAMRSQVGPPRVGVALRSEGGGRLSLDRSPAARTRQATASPQTVVSSPSAPSPPQGTSQTTGAHAGQLLGVGPLAR
jgi:hypothetical protein